MWFRFIILFSYLVIIAEISTAQNLKVVNRNLSVDSTIRLNEAPGVGIAWFKNKFSYKVFANGIIEFDARGRNVPQGSFLGIAFHGVNDSTYDAVYFRPFNFQAADKERQKHSVQYISMPKYDWELLRTDHPGKYENDIIPAPDPTSWFHVKIIVEWPMVTAFVNDKQVLSVKQLSEQKNGHIGFWVGNTSPGEFKNLKIK